jgi:hypothetical protein
VREHIMSVVFPALIRKNALRRDPDAAPDAAALAAAVRADGPAFLGALLRAIPQLDAAYPGWTDPAWRLPGLEDPERPRTQLTPPPSRSPSAASRAEKRSPSPGAEFAVPKRPRTSADGRLRRASEDTLVGSPARKPPPARQAPVKREEPEEMAVDAPASAWPLPVPGLWYSAEGTPIAKIHEIQFDADAAFVAQAQRWARRERGAGPWLAVTLRCVTVADVGPLQQRAAERARDGDAASPAEITAELCALENRWPARGIIASVEINDVKNGGKRWMARTKLMVSAF